EAVDFACLDALVAWRRAHGLPAPVAESARDREEFARSVRAFLERLRDAIAVGLTSEQRAKLDAAAHAGGDPTERLLTVQVALALPAGEPTRSTLGSERAPRGSWGHRQKIYSTHDDLLSRGRRDHLRGEDGADVLLRLSRDRAPPLPDRARPDRRGPRRGGHADARRERGAHVARAAPGRAVRRAPGADRARRARGPRR